MYISHNLPVIADAVLSEIIEVYLEPQWSLENKVIAQKKKGESNPLVMLIQKQWVKSNQKQIDTVTISPKKDSGPGPNPWISTKYWLDWNRTDMTSKLVILWLS